MRRSLRIWAGLALALFAVTCTDRGLTGPGQRGAASFDLRAFATQAPGDPPIPADSARITVRRVAAELPHVDTTIAIIGIRNSDSAQITLSIAMDEAREDVQVSITIVGGGVNWFTGTTNVTLVAGGTAQPSTPLTLTYVGPGATADSVRITMAATQIVGGIGVTVGGAVWVPGGILTGVPVGYRVGDSTVATITPLGISNGRLTGRVPVRDSTWLYAETPTHLTDSILVHVVPPPSQLQKQSGDTQSGAVGVPLAQAICVRVMDGLGDPVAGVTVNWAVAIGGAGLSATSTVSDTLGVTCVLVTPMTAGAVAVTASAASLAPVTFTFTIATAAGPANVAIVAGNGQTAPAGSTLPIAPAVHVTDAGGAPLQDVPVTFAVTGGNGSIAGATPLTNASGIATLGSWTLGTIAGPNALSATVTGLTPVTFGAIGTPGPPTTVVVISGSNQTAPGGTVLTAPLVIEVRDPLGNGVSGIPVNWSVSHGSVAPTSGLTNGAGRAQTSWTLGTNATSQTATATVSGLTPAVFNATATFAAPSILLALIGGDRVAVGGNRDVQVSLTTPAGTGGVTVSVTSDNIAFVSVDSSGNVFIPQGQSQGVIGLNGVSQGTALVRGNAPGYAEGTVSVQSSVQVLSMPTTLNVAFGGTASVPLTLSAPAPAGGTTVSLVSSDPSRVSVTTPTVTILQGSTTANATVNGVLPGTVTLTGTTAAFGSAQTIVSTTANLNILESSATLSQAIGTTVTIRFESQGVARAAPAPGITVTLTAGDPACLGAPATVTIPTGQVETTAALTYGGSGTTPCTTSLTATAPNIGSDAINATVNPPPGIFLSAVTVGSGLQESASGSLAAPAPIGGTAVTLTSTNPAVVRVSPNPSTVGTAAITINMSQGTSSFGYYVQGVEGATDTATITVSAPGYANGSAIGTVRGTGFDIIFLGTSTTTLSPNAAFSVRIGVVNAQGNAYSAEQAIRAGGAPVTATLTSTDPLVGRLITSVDTGGTATVSITAGQSRSPGSVASGGVAFDPLTAGTTSVAATIPGFVALSGSQLNVTVNAPAITMSAPTVGSGLQEFASGSLGAAVPVGGATLHIASSNPAVLLVSPNASTPGTSSIDVPLTAGSTSFSYYVQGMEGASDTVAISASIPAYANGSAIGTVRGTALDIIFLGTTTTSLSPDIPFAVRIGVLNAAGNAYTAEQSIRAGGTGVTATLTSSDTLVGKLVTTAQSGGTATVDIAPQQSRSPGSVATGGVAFDPQSAGTTTVAASIPGFLALAGAQVNVTVSAPVINLSAVTVGRGLQEFASGSLTAAAPTGGVTLHIASSNPAVLLVSPNASTPGGPFIDIPLNAGASSFSYYVQGVEGVADTATLTASIPAYTNGTAIGTVRGTGLDIIFLGTSTTTLSPDIPFAVRIGVLNAAGNAYTAEQSIRAGGTGVTATLTSSAPTVGLLVTSGGSGGTVTVDIGPQQSRSPGTVATGGVAFDPLADGTTTVAASIVGYTALAGAQVNVTITSPAINLSAATVGTGLQEFASGSFATAVPAGGTVLHIVSSDPTTVLLSRDAVTPGAPSIDISLNAGASSFSYYVQGLEGRSGTVTVTASAPGYTDGTATATVRGTALDIIFLGTSSTTLNPDVPFAVRIGVINTLGTGYTAEQAIRAGGSAVTASLTTSNPAVGQLVTSVGSGGSATVVIGVGQSRSPGTVATGGVAFDPQTAGTTSVVAAIPGYTALPGAQVNVTVTVPTITISDVAVGAGLQEFTSGFLQAAALAGGVQVLITSSNPSRVLVSPDAATPGASSITITVNQGSSTFSYYLQGVEGMAGTATVTASAALYSDGTATETVRGPALDIIFLGSSTTAGAANIPFSVRIGVPNEQLTGYGAEQAIRAGGTGVTATISSSTPTVATLVTSTLTAGTVTVSIDPGQARSPGTVASGGVALDPLSVGSTTVTATIPGFLALPNATIPVTVNP